MFNIMPYSSSIADSTYTRTSKNMLVCAKSNKEHCNRAYGAYFCAKTYIF